MMRYAQAKFSSQRQQEEAERKRGHNDPYSVMIDFEVNSPTWLDAVAARFASFGARMVRYGR